MDFDFIVIRNNIGLLLEGLLLTVGISLLVTLLAGILGLILAFMEVQGGRVVRSAVKIYTSFFRTIPELSLIFWVYFCLPPMMDLRLSAFTCGVMALTLISAAYFGEIFRAGVEAIGKGQIEASVSLGLSTYWRWREIILPQAIESMTPAFVNYFTEILKNSTLLSAIGAAEIAYQAYSIGASTYRYVEPLTMVAVFFFLIIFPLSLWTRRREAKRAVARHR